MPEILELGREAENCTQCQKKTEKGKKKCEKNCKKLHFKKVTIKKKTATLIAKIAKRNINCEPRNTPI